MILRFFQVFHENEIKIAKLRQAAIAFVCTICKRQLLFVPLQLITFVCTSAIENILRATVIVNFFMH